MGLPSETSVSVDSRQAWLVEPGRFEIRNVEISPQPVDVLVKVRVCGLCTWELNHWKGKLGQCPQSLGHEVSGVVAATGAAVLPEQFAEGDLVTGLVAPSAGFADYALIPHEDCIKLDENVPLDEALGEPLKCVVTVLRCADPEAGDVGVILGCGSMGLWCVQALAGSQIAALVAVDIDDRKLSLAKKFGATHTINPQACDAVAHVEELSDGHMADFVIEGTGHPETLNNCADYLRLGRGKLVLMSSHEDGGAGFDWRKPQAKAAQILIAHPAYSLDTRDDLRRTRLLLNKGTFASREVITHRFALEQIEEAFRTLENKPAGYIKGVVDFGRQR